MPWWAWLAAIAIGIVSWLSVWIADKFGWLEPPMD